MMRLLKVNFAISTVFLFLFAISSTVVAQDNEKTDKSFSDWDQNADSTLSQDEFNSALVDMGYYKEWDADGNDSISEEEWNDGVETYFVDYDYGEYNAWDEDGDGIVSEDEFDNGIFDLVDQDANDIVEQDEFISWWGVDEY